MSDYISAYVQDFFYKKNKFVHSSPEQIKLPKFDEIKDFLPEPVFDNHPDEINAYYKAWKIAFRNLGNPTKKNGFVSPYIDAAFNGYIFMWDSCFMLMFGKYGDSVHPFQRTLDNFYCKQEPDGFIGREISEDDGQSHFYRMDPVSTGPEIMAWCEWQYYKCYKNKERLKNVYYPLLSFHRWLKANHRWQDGSYWSSGWGCGMDNLPRCDIEAVPDTEDWQLGTFHHSFMTWIDAMSQAVISCDYLIEMAKEIDTSDGVEELKAERDFLNEYINKYMWSEEDRFYYDRKRDGSLLKVKSAASFWQLLVKSTPKDRIDAICEHLENKNEFNRPNRVPALSADHPDYCEEGDYWNGSVWPPILYMVLSGLTANGKDKLADDIARCAYGNMLDVYKTTGTFWENYAPEKAAPGKPARKDFVGWTGIIPITVLIEYILGIQVSADKNEIVWHINELDRHGIKHLPIGRNQFADLICQKRNSPDEQPKIDFVADKDITLRVIYGDNIEMVIR